ncbi:MAG: beta-phosphoglucomutase [Bacteroidales bacterium]|jgi:beta-phosphoglucomutase|nr:beta-phosphoglucomutase [Bacteroidales bacterium]
MIKACIFDMDGVLVSTEKYHFKAWQRLAATLGIAIDEEFNENLKGVSRAVCVDLILEHGGVVKTDEEKQQLAAQKNEWFLQSISHISPRDIFPGVREFLTLLQSHGYKIALGSASKNAPLLLEKLQITHFFDAVIDGNSIEKAKPNPEVFLKGAAALGIAPQHCVVFEDAISGVQAARAAGMYCIGIGSPKILTQAHFCIAGLHEMNLALLEELCNS